MRLAINLTLSLGMLALCMWLVWPGGEERGQLSNAFSNMHLRDFAPYLLAYFGLQTVVHICRSVRWNNLLAPLGVKVPLGPLLAMSSVGFMMILALPARLGEFVRPGLLRQRGYTTASKALGTVAVERIVDGLVISIVVFFAFLALKNPSSPGWMMTTAYVALGVFSGFLIFLAFALWKPEPTVRFCLKMSLLPRFAPRVAETIEHKALDVIRGFTVLKDVKNFSIFLAWTIVYWTANGIGVWVLARAFGLELSIVGAFATMGLLGVGISLPNSPGLVGQFQYFTLLGLSLYLGFDPNPAKDAAPDPVYIVALAFAIVQHLLQVVWYVAMGAISLATPWVSFHDLWTARKQPVEEPAAVAVQQEL
jgi:uncharacterized protein (TIRG00374 family)